MGHTFLIIEGFLLQMFFSVCGLTRLKKKRLKKFFEKFVIRLDIARKGEKAKLATLAEERQG